ncbi:hypothetical protein UCDDS831_g03260 [Diplodia seriata]|uniref:Uncharacterized protein n=1 Tax=Diplodia seriata TaxID=420778 RepID=A0A0G2H2X7_9PEZI|nr:hypothetical protein UCDDS831_g03260 [Diplodia seriata]
MPIFTHEEVSKYARRLLEDMSFLQEAVMNNISGRDKEDPVKKGYRCLVIDLWSCHDKLNIQIGKFEDTVEQAESESDEQGSQQAQAYSQSIKQSACKRPQSDENDTDGQRGNSYAPQTLNCGRYSPTAIHQEDASPRYEPQSPHYYPSPAPLSPTGDLPIYPPFSPNYPPFSPIYEPTSPRYEPTSSIDYQQPTPIQAATYLLNNKATTPPYSPFLPDYKPSSPHSPEPITPLNSPYLSDYKPTPLLHQDSCQQHEATNRTFPLHNTPTSDLGFAGFSPLSPSIPPQRPFRLPGNDSPSTTRNDPSSPADSRSPSTIRLDPAHEQATTNEHARNPSSPPDFFTTTGRPSFGRSSSILAAEDDDGDDNNGFDRGFAATAAAWPRFQVDGMPEQHANAFVRGVDRLVDVYGDDDAISPLELGGRRDQEEGDGEVRFLGCCRKRPAAEAPMYGVQRPAVRRRLY